MIMPVMSNQNAARFTGEMYGSAARTATNDNLCSAANTKNKAIF